MLPTTKRLKAAAVRLIAVAGTLAAVVGLAACGSSSSGGAGNASTGNSGADAKITENYDAPPKLLQTAFGTTTGIPRPLLAAVTRAGQSFTGDKLKLAVKCWKGNICETGTGGKYTVALADGFGDNVWRQVTHMEFVLQALTYPQIGKIIYTNGHGDAATQVSDLRSLIAQRVNVIAGFPDAGPAVLPLYRQATKAGIVAVPYISSPTGTPGKDYLTFVAEDLCQLGKNFASTLNKEVGSGAVAFLGGTPGNLLSQTWQKCARPALDSSIKVVGPADTNWTRSGTLTALSGMLSKDPAIKGVAYEYADGFLGGLRAYKAANIEPNITLTLRTDENDLFCEWKKMKNPKFKVFYSSGGGFDSRFALTAAMMKLAGQSVPPNVTVPIHMHQVTDSTCQPNLPGQAPVSTLLPKNVLDAMYPSS